MESAAPVAVWVFMHNDIIAAIARGTRPEAANSRALEMACVQAMADPPDGRILRDHDGRATLMLRKVVIRAVLNRVPDLSAGNVREGLRRRQAPANSKGDLCRFSWVVTGAIDPDFPAHVE